MVTFEIAGTIRDEREERDADCDAVLAEQRHTVYFSRRCRNDRNGQVAWSRYRNERRSRAAVRGRLDRRPTRDAQGSVRETPEDHSRSIRRNKTSNDRERADDRSRCSGVHDETIL